MFSVATVPLMFHLYRAVYNATAVHSRRAPEVGGGSKRFREMAAEETFTVEELFGGSDSDEVQPLPPPKIDVEEATTSADLFGSDSEGGDAGNKKVTVSLKDDLFGSDSDEERPKPSAKSDLFGNDSEEEASQGRDVSSPQNSLTFFSTLVLIPYFFPLCLGCFHCAGILQRRRRH